MAPTGAVLSIGMVNSFRWKIWKQPMKFHSMPKFISVLLFPAGWVISSASDFEPSSTISTETGLYLKSPALFRATTTTAAATRTANKLQRCRPASSAFRRPHNRCSNSEYYRLVSPRSPPPSKNLSSQCPHLLPPSLARVHKWPMQLRCVKLSPAPLPAPPPTGLL